MAKKNKNKNKENEGEKKEGGDNGANSNNNTDANANNNKKNNDKGNITVVLKTELHCDGCATKVAKCIRSCQGVETVSIGDGGKVTVVGKVDPAKLREKVEEKTHRKVELVSPQVKKENKDAGGAGALTTNNKEDKGKGDQQKKNKDKDKNSKEKEHDKNKSAAADDKKAKPKEPPVTTAVLKVNLHCQGCIEKIYKLVSKTKGYQDMKIDKQKDLVTVTGAIDMKALAEILKKHLKRQVEIVPPKKDAEKKDNAGGDKANNGGGGKEKGGGNSGGGKEKGGNGNGGGGGGDGGEGENRMQFQVGYPYPPQQLQQPYVYGPAPGFAGDHQFHYNPYPIVPAPQMFSDENPNACSVM